MHAHIASRSIVPLVSSAGAGDGHGAEHCRDDVTAVTTYLTHAASEEHGARDDPVWYV